MSRTVILIGLKIKYVIINVSKCYVLDNERCMNFLRAPTTNESQLSFSRYAFLSDYLYTGKSKKKFVKSCPQWGWKPGPPDLQANALPTELGRNLLGRRFLQ